MRKGCDGNPEITILFELLAIEPHFVRKACDGNPDIAILPQVLAIEPHFVRKGCTGQVEIAILPKSLAIEHLISCKRVVFRAVSLALPRAFKREIEKKEMARGQEDKRRRCEDVRMWR